MAKTQASASKKNPIRFQSNGGKEASSAAIDRLVEEMIGRVADKWTMLLLEALAQNGVVRFSRLAELVGGISQKMLTQTLRQMEADGLLTRTVYPVVPPRVEYALAPLGESLAASFCGVWEWAEKNYAEVQRHRARYCRKLGLETEVTSLRAR